MQNEEGSAVDLYIPRKCSWTNRLLTSKDHGTVQINVANVDAVTGRATGEYTPLALSGYLRFHSEGDEALTELVRKNDEAVHGNSISSTTMMSTSVAAGEGAPATSTEGDGTAVVGAED